MTRRTRLLIGSLICAAIGACASSVPNVTDEQRVKLEVFALQQACEVCAVRKCTDNPEVLAVCAVFKPVAMVRPEPVITSGDSGPPWSGPGAGNGVRSIGGAGAK